MTLCLNSLLTDRFHRPVIAHSVPGAVPGVVRAVSWRELGEGLGTALGGVMAFQRFWARDFNYGYTLGEIPSIFQ